MFFFHKDATSAAEAAAAANADITYRQ